MSHPVILEEGEDFAKEQAQKAGGISDSEARLHDLRAASPLREFCDFIASFASDDDIDRDDIKKVKRIYGYLFAIRGFFRWF